MKEDIMWYGWIVAFFLVLGFLLLGLIFIYWAVKKTQAFVDDKNYDIRKEPLLKYLNIFRKKSDETEGDILVVIPPILFFLTIGSVMWPLMLIVIFWICTMFLLRSVKRLKNKVDKLSEIMKESEK